MRLLPDIQVDGHILSMQPPYTLDGKLISNIATNVRRYNMLTRQSYEDGVRFELDDCCGELCISLPHIKNAFEEKAKTISSVGDKKFPYEINGEWFQEYTSFDSFIESIKYQCNHMHSGRNHYFAMLQAMGRISAKRMYIHAFDYKPEYIKHDTEIDKACQGSPLFLGVEIEVAGNDHEPDREKVVKKCIQIMNRSDSDKEDIIYSTSDSTVQIELDVMPCTMKFHKTLPYKELFHYLDTEGYKGHDAENAGLHIHADLEYLGKTKLKQKLVISKILYLLEKFNNQVCVIARKNNKFSEFLGDGNNDALYLLDRYKGIKRAALNLCHNNTIEFRMFRSTLKYEIFMLTLEFVKDIIDYAKSCNIEDIEQMKWEDLYASFSPELKAYYDNRLEKQRKEKEEIDKCVNGGALFVNGSPIDDRFVLIQLADRWNNVYEMTVRQAERPLYMTSSESRSEDPGDSVRQIHHKINSLKSELKHCQNYNRRNVINQQLEHLYKEKRKLRKARRCTNR